MTRSDHNAKRGLTDDEAFEIAVQHVLNDLNWPLIVTEEQARALVSQLRSQTRGRTPAGQRIEAEHCAALIDLSDPATRAAYFGETA